MNNTLFTLTTDTCADLPADYLAKKGLAVASLTYFVDDIEYGTDENPFEDEHEFYEQMRKGRLTKTSQVNPDVAYGFLKANITPGVPHLHISFSSALSGTCNSFEIAAQRLCEENPDMKICVFDSLCASLGLGLFIDYTLDMRASGMTIDETVAALTALRPKMRHLFTVDDLGHLYRGGRVSKMAAIFGGMLGIKPMLHAEEGRLVFTSKVRGRRAALDMLVTQMLEQMDKARVDRFFISHGDCLAEAQYVAGQIIAATGVKENIINFVGPVIGAHSGPGCVALFFIGK